MGRYRITAIALGVELQRLWTETPFVLSLRALYRGSAWLVLPAPGKGCSGAAWPELTRSRRSSHGRSR
jgi:hypothetical protein